MAERPQDVPCAPGNIHPGLRSLAARRRRSRRLAAARLGIPDPARLPRSGARLRELPVPGDSLPRTAAARARTHPLGMTRSAPIRAGSAAESADGLRPADLRSAYFPGEPPAPRVRTADDRARGRLQRSPRRSRPGGIRPRIRPAPLHRRRRVLQEGQSARRNREPAVRGTGKRRPPAGRSRSPPTSRSPTRSARTATSCSWRPNRLVLRPRSRRGDGRQTRRHRGLQLLGGRRADMSIARPSTTPGPSITAAAGDNGYLNWTEATEAGSENISSAPTTPPPRPTWSRSAAPS